MFAWTYTETRWRPQTPEVVRVPRFLGIGELFGHQIWVLDYARLNGGHLVPDQQHIIR